MESTIPLGVAIRQVFESTYKVNKIRALGKDITCPKEIVINKVILHEILLLTYDQIKERALRSYPLDIVDLIILNLEEILQTEEMA